MEMNPQTRGLSGLHREYTDCLADEMKKFLSLPLAERKQVGKNHPGFCLDQKKAFYAHMRVNNPIEFENMERLDENIYL